MKSDEEMRLAYDLFVDDAGILNLVILGEIRGAESSTRLSELIQQDVITILDKNPHKKYDMIVNLLPLARGGYASSKARKTYLQISSHRQLGRFAIVGGSVFARTMAGFFVRAAGKGEYMKWFAVKPAALEWLKESA